MTRDYLDLVAQTHAAPDRYYHIRWTPQAIILRDANASAIWFNTPDASNTTLTVSPSL